MYQQNLDTVCSCVFVYNITQIAVQIDHAKLAVHIYAHSNAQHSMTCGYSITKKSLRFDVSVFKGE